MSNIKIKQVKSSIGGTKIQHDTLKTLGLGKMQVLEPTGAGKIKYLKAGSTTLPKKKTPYNPPADLRK